MDRRDLLKGAGAVGVAAAVPVTDHVPATEPPVRFDGRVTSFDYDEPLNQIRFDGTSSPSSPNPIVTLHYQYWNEDYAADKRNGLVAPMRVKPDSIEFYGLDPTDGIVRVGFARRIWRVTETVEEIDALIARPQG